MFKQKQSAIHTLDGISTTDDTKSSTMDFKLKSPLIIFLKASTPSLMAPTTLFTIFLNCFTRLNPSLGSISWNAMNITVTVKFRKETWQVFPAMDVALAAAGQQWEWLTHSQLIKDLYKSVGICKWHKKSAGVVIYVKIIKKINFKPLHNMKKN